MDFKDSIQRIGKTFLGSAGAPLMVVMLLVMIIVPIPPFFLDFFFTISIAFSLVILLVVISTQRPLDFTLFPSVLLIATLFRLALNVASTRIVLLEGHTGTAAAGKVIEAFGTFVIGGNYAVGLVIFVILIIINFVVVTKGAGRISEVTARFTLDAMPGKQMAIDADLNAGLIDQEQASLRREEVSREADFYGAMDGASKFVRGDAIAGILILIINIVGGFTIGMLQHEMLLADALQNYTMLTIGDGLVAQIPSLVLSTAAAMIVTRDSASRDMGEQVRTQLFSSPKVLITTALIIGGLGLIPGMPNVSFLMLAAIIGGLGYAIHRKESVAQPEEEMEEVEPAAPAAEDRDLSWDDISPVDMIGLEVGYRLIPLVDKGQGGELMTRIKGIRNKLSQDLGFLVQRVHIRDNLDLSPNDYRILLMGVAIGEGEIYVDRDLAINPGHVYGVVEGIATKDPTFQLDAVWVEPSQRENAQAMGYTVVDPSTVVATHLSELLRQHAYELLGHEEVQQLLDKLTKNSPKLVENLVPNTLNLATILKVLQYLLEEGVPIRDFRTIAETLAEHGTKSQDPVTLTSAVRVALNRSIVQRVFPGQDELSVMTLDPALEQLLLQSFQASGDGLGGIEPGLLDRFLTNLRNSSQSMQAQGTPVVLLVASHIRHWMARFLRASFPDMQTLSYNEIPGNKQIKVVATIGQAQS